MTDRMDILAIRSYAKDGETKTAFTKIGVAFATKTGGWQLVFEALPIASLSDKGTIETRALMKPPQPRDGGSPASDTDSVPF